MEKPKKTHFEDFLKALFWKDPSIPILDPGIFADNNSASRVRTGRSFRNILSKMDDKERQDFDDLSVFLWRQYLKNHSPAMTAKRRARSRPKARQPLNINFSWQAAYAAVVILALALTAGLFLLSPLLGKKLARSLDSQALAAIKFSYCSLAAEDIICQPAPDYQKNVVVKRKIDKDILSSYIAGNQASLKELKADSSLVIDQRDLEGRVAGAAEN